MGGQDGFSRDILKYNEESNSILAGVKIHPSDSWDLGLNFGYTESTGGMDPFELPADDYVANTPSMSYDFSKSNTYSNIDIDRFNGLAGARVIGINHLDRLATEVLAQDREFAVPERRLVDVELVGIDGALDDSLAESVGGSDENRVPEPGLGIQREYHAR